MKESGHRKNAAGNALRIVRAIVLAVLAVLLVLPSALPCINQVFFGGFVAKIEREALRAHLEIHQLKFSHSENGSSTAVSAGASGVVIGRDGDLYFALTALHVAVEVPGPDRTRITVLGSADEEFRDAYDQGGASMGNVADYYLQFPEARVVYSDADCDLAIIAFTSEEDLTVLPIAEEVPHFGDRIAAMGNPWGKRNLVTAGIVVGWEKWTFGEGAQAARHPILRETAWSSEGSSGGALLNDKLEIAGLVVGGDKDLFGRPLRGVAVPCDRIRTFLDDWKNGT